MKSNQMVLIIVLATFAGFIGGFISNQIFQKKSSIAEKEPKPQKIVIAEEFRVVDTNNETRASFGFVRHKGRLDTIELRLLTPAYNKKSPSGILISASNSNSGLYLFGAGSSINMNTTALLERKSSRLQIGKAEISVKGQDYPVLPIRISDSSIPTIDDSSHITMSAGASSDGPSIEIADRKGKTRAVFGTVSLTETKIGESTARTPSSLILFDKSENVIWRAP